MLYQDSTTATAGNWKGADWYALQAKWSKPATTPGRGADGRRPSPPTAAPRLGSTTHFDTYRDAVRSYPGPSLMAVLKNYGPNGAKLILRTTHERPQLSRPDPEPEEKQEKEQNRGLPRALSDTVNLRRAAWRARAQVEDWIRMTALPGTDYRLCTGTKRGGFIHLGEVWEAVAKMRRQVERNYPGLKLIAVPELHHGDGANRDTYHVHMLLVFPAGVRPMYAVFHRLWYRAIGGTGREKGAAAPGNFDFAKTHARDGTRYSPCQAARYVSKYVTKDLTHGNVGQKRFTKSHGAPDPVRRYWWEPIALSQDMTRAHAVSLLRGQYPADKFAILSRTFHDGGDTFHVFSAEPVPG